MNSMVEVLAGHAVSEPDNLFIADSYGYEYTYIEAWKCVKRFAYFLVNDADVHFGDKVMVECNQDAFFLLIDLACNLIGAVFVPVENGASAERKKCIFEETEARVWISKSEKLKYVESFLAEAIMESDSELSDYSFKSGDTVAEILYTTGTTGKSKGIVISNSANVALAENIKFGVKMNLGNTELIPIPISHSHGIRCCYANLLNGGTIVLADGLLKVKIAFELIDKYKVTAIDISPSAAQLLIKISKGKFWEYGSRMDYIQIGTAALPEQLKEQLISELPNVRLYNFYGSTESGRSCVLEFSSVLGKKNCIGKPTKNSEILFTDDSREFINASEANPGLLASRGKMNMNGYWKNPELTVEIMRDNCVFTNDLGYMDSEGYVYVIGRKDDVINYNGIKIAPEEIEQAACDFEGVKDCACVPMADPIAGQVPRLFIEVDNPQTFEMKEYLNFLYERLDSNKVPKRVDFIDKIPRTANGKIKRKEL